LLFESLVVSSYTLHLRSTQQQITAKNIYQMITIPTATAPFLDQQAIKKHPKMGNENKTRKSKNQRKTPKQPLKASYINWLLTVRNDVLMLFLRVLAVQLEKEGDKEMRKKVMTIIQKRNGHITSQKVAIVKEVRDCVGRSNWDKAIGAMKLRLSGSH